MAFEPAALARITEAFRASVAVPVLTKARIEGRRPGGGPGSPELGREILQVLTTWSQLNIAEKKKVCFGKTFLVDKYCDSEWIKKDSKDKIEFRFLSEGFPVPLAAEDISEYSYVNGIRVTIRKTKNDKSEDMFLLDVWRQNFLCKSFNLSDEDLHGPVWFDSEFGGIAINSDATKVAYVAEAKKEKNTPFFKPKPKAAENNTNESSGKELIGQEYRYREEWGEQMVGKSEAVIVVLDVITGEFRLWSGIPGDWDAGQLVWYRDDLYGAAVTTAPRRLGIKLCSNRPSVIFRLTASGEYTVLSDREGVASRFPRISEKGLLVYVERNLGDTIYPGPHQAVYRLIKMELSELPEKVPTQEVVAQITYSPSEEEGGGFGGISGDEDVLPRNCFLFDGTKLITSLPVKGTLYPVIFDLAQGTPDAVHGEFGHKFLVVRGAPNVHVLDVQQSLIVGMKSTLVRRPVFTMARYNLDMQDLHFIDFPAEHQTDDDLVPNKTSEVLDIAEPQLHPDKRFSHVTYNALYVGPTDGELSSVPLILLPHGGPHGELTNAYNSTIHFFLELGYATLLVNYRGSLGNGEDGVKSLLCHIGDIDVKDCHMAREQCLKKYKHLDPHKVLLFGGSHGGFVVMHLAGQYPDSYRAVVARNGVYNLSSMAGVTDIPDWTFNEAGLTYNFKPADAEQLKILYEKSPIRHAKNIKCPVLLNVGKEDLRVPPSQSVQLYNCLRALGKEVEMFEYEDNHSLAKPSVNINVLMNAARFYEQTLN